jgi:hypothetical protein
MQIPFFFENNAVTNVLATDSAETAFIDFGNKKFRFLKRNWPILSPGLLSFLSPNKSAVLTTTVFSKPSSIYLFSRSPLARL